MLWLCCLALVAEPFPDPLFIDPGYDSSAYAERSALPPSAWARLKGEALLWCVRAGMKPQLVTRLFGPPSVTAAFRRGPVEWWYPELGVTACFPPRMFRPDPKAARVHGGVGP